MKKLRLRNIWTLAKGHAAGKGQSLDLNPDFLSSESMLSVAALYDAIYAEQRKDTGEGLRVKIV